MLKQPLRFLLLPLPQPAAPSAGAVARGTSLPTRDEDHATLCDPLAVAAGQAVCASLAFSIAAPEPELTTHTYHPFRRPIQWRLSSNERLITSMKEKQKKPKKKKKSAHPPNRRTNKQTPSSALFMDSAGIDPFASRSLPLLSLAFCPTSLSWRHSVAKEAEWHYVCSQSEGRRVTKRKGAQPAPRALRRFIYLFYHLFIFCYSF